MGILIGLFQQMRKWDAMTKIAFALAIVLLIPVILVAVSGPEQVRNGALIGAAGLMLTMQLIAMWGNRHMVTPYTRAQRLFIAGDYEAARDVLVQHIAESDKVDVDVYVLLGNTYRNLGRLEKSEELLRKALDITPSYHFPLYGFGRTLLASGDYAGAVSYFEKALEQGAPSVVRFDLGHAQYRLGEKDAAYATLSTAEITADEPHRRLMQAFLLNRLGLSQEWTLTGVDYWQMEAERFAHTPYGRALLADIQAMQALPEEE